MERPVSGGNVCTELHHLGRREHVLPWGRRPLRQQKLPQRTR